MPLNDAFSAAAAAVAQQTQLQVEVQDRATRYFFFAGDEPGVGEPGGMSVETRCVPNYLIRRCEVTPCLTVPVWSRPEEIPEGMRIAGSLNDTNGKMQYWLNAGPEAVRLIESYGNPGEPAKQWGLVELTALRGRDLQEVAAMQITRLFFPQWPSIPATNEAVATQIVEALAAVNDGNYPPELRAIYMQCGREMLAAAEAAQRYQSEHVADVNMRVTLPATDDKFKRGFDEKDRLFAKRSGVALAMNSLRGNQSDMINAVLQKLADRPEAPAVDAQAIGAIVAATVAAMKEQGAETRTEASQPQPKPKAIRQPQPQQAREAV